MKIAQNLAQMKEKLCKVIPNYAENVNKSTITEILQNCLPRQHLQIADGRVCVKGYSRKAWSHFQLRDRFRCHQQRRNLERHRQPGLSAGTGGVEETWDWKNGIYKLF